MDPEEARQTTSNNAAGRPSRPEEIVTTALIWRARLRASSPARSRAWTAATITDARASATERSQTCRVCDAPALEAGGRRAMRAFLRHRGANSPLARRIAARPAATALAHRSDPAQRCVASLDQRASYQQCSTRHRASASRPPRRTPAVSRLISRAARRIEPFRPALRRRDPPDAPASTVPQNRLHVEGNDTHWRGALARVRAASRLS